MGSKKDKAKKDDPSTSKDTEKEEKEKVISYISLYRYADGWDWLAVIVGGLAALAHGILTPIFIIFFGDVIDSFGASSDPNSLVFDVTQTAYYILYLACGAFATSYLQVFFFTMSAQRQTLRIRKLYFRSLIRQEMAWYDTQQAGTLTTRISSDIPSIQEALGDKFGSFLQFTGMFLGGIIVGFLYGWQLTLLVLGIGPLVGIGGALMSKFIGDVASGGLGFFADANNLADEVLRMIKTVIAFETQDVEQERFNKAVDDSMKAGIKSAKYQGFGMGYTFFIIFASYPLAFWLGQYLVEEGQMSGGDVLLVFFAVIVGAMSIGQAAPNIAVMAKGRAAGTKIFQVIDRVPVIDSLSDDGDSPKSINGALKFENVNFTYPTRPDEQVLHDFSLEIKPKETVALVGHSGCGKSTTIALLERFYDPDSGTISLDGKDVRKLNIQWYRSQIALVSQTPSLFPTTIEENIAIGRAGATKEDVISAAKKANAHDFIMSLPDKYRTNVGDLGTQLSGGQRQRIAIARALINNPAILLLDEATSALDNESEAIVKEALDKASTHRTTIVIAHRLSTVFSADKIVVVRAGKIVEAGAPQDLLDQMGIFYDMVASQHGSHGQGRARIDIKTLLETEGDVDLEKAPTTASLEQAKSPHTTGATSEKDVAIDVTLTNDMKEDSPKDDAVPDVDRSMIGWVWELSKPERCSMIIGIICSMIEGGVWGVYAILLAEIINVLSQDNSQTEVNKWAGGFFGLAATILIVIFFKFYLLGAAGERLTARLRKAAFHVIIHQKAEWYEAPEHSRGILTSRLAQDASLVRGVLGDRLGLMFQLFSLIATGLTVALVYCWRVGLVVLASFPIIAIAGAIQLKMVSGFTTTKAFEQSGKFASQSIEQVRTVAALGRLDNFVEDYYKTLAYPTSVMRRSAQVQGITFGVSEFCIFAVWSLAFWYGSEVVEDGNCGFTEMFTAQMAILFMGMMAGQVTTFGPDVAKATGAAKRLYRLLTDHAKFVEEEEKKTYAKPAIKGHIQFKDVEFHYSSRPDAQVLRGLNLSITPGKTIALVGPSGCGKSTTISLIERYYDPTAGAIIIDGVNARDIDPKHLRKHMAIVTQQPELFASSITSNIVYGLNGNVPDELVAKAAKDANAYDFIQEFEDKFETKVGDKGEQLSGGQRQRIAVARALIRADDIKILLLDEASAALDTESEKLVHHALDKARKGRTTVIVAHRLSTIKNADEIAVINEGVVVEQGSHDELMAKEGAYYNLVHSQEFVTYDEDDSADSGNNSNSGDGDNGNTQGDAPSNATPSSTDASSHDNNVQVINFSMDVGEGEDEDDEWKNISPVEV